MIRVLKNLSIVKLLFLLLPCGLAALSSPRLQPLEYVARYADHLESLEVDELIQLSLHMSGTAPEELESLTRRFRDLIEQFRSTHQSTEPVGVAEEILTFMHSAVLKKYTEKQTRMDILLKEGIFNCVSSSVLYLILARSVDLHVWGIKTVDHAFCRVSTPTADMDVETTNPYGFNPGEKKQFTDEFGNVTGFNYVPPGKYRDRSEITLTQLMGLILQNRITFLTEKRQYTQAAELGVDYWMLLQDRDAREVLVSGFLNMWKVYDKVDGFEPGIAFYDEVLRSFGEDKQLLTNRDNLVHNYMVILTDAGRLEEARRLLDRRESGGLLEPEAVKKYNMMLTVKQVQGIAASSYAEAITMINTVTSRFGPDKDLAGLKNTYVHNLIVEKIQHDLLDEAYKLCAGFKGSGDLTEKDWKELVGYIYQKRALLHQNDFLAAAEILAAGLREVGENRDLRKQYEAYIYNYEITMHNRMVGLYNKHQFAEAQTIIEEALQAVPGSKRLTDDLKQIREALAVQ